MKCFIHHGTCCTSGSQARENMGSLLCESVLLFARTSTVPLQFIQRYLSRGNGDSYQNRFYRREDVGKGRSLLICGSICTALRLYLTCHNDPAFSKLHTAN